MTEKELQELEAENFLASLTTTHEDYSHIDDTQLDLYKPPSKEQQLKELYQTLWSIDSQLSENQDSMTTRELIDYRKSISSDIASLEGRMNTNDTTKYIPMNVTFNVQNNY